MSNPRLSIIPAGAVIDRSLEPRDLQMLALLGCYTDKQGWCRRSQVKMARQIACGRSSVQRSLDRLVEAGWVQKKRPAWSSAEGQPSHSYEYRVILDRDDAPLIVLEDDETDDAESHAPDATQAEECPPVGTPGAQPDGHPGAHTGRAPGAHTYVGTKNDPLERPLIERERDARARDRKARFLASFEQRWPTAAVDDRQRTGYAAEALTEREETEALAGIAPFLENLRKLHRKGVPAGWRYLEEKRWTLLDQAKPEPPAQTQFAASSREGNAIAALFDIAGKIEFFYKAVCRSGTIYHKTEITPQLLALADLKPRAEWRHALTRQQAGAWNSFIESWIGGLSHLRLVEGSIAPEPWPPKKDGTWSPVPEGPAMTPDDIEAFANEGQR